MGANDVRWVTRSHIHLDRVASPWLIRRFVDRDAVFEFVEPHDPVPGDATPFALPGADFGPHDERGSTFRKILQAYAIDAVELQRMADVVDAGIVVALGRDPVVEADLLHLAVALAAFSEAMTVLRPDDYENLRDSVMYYDALYQTLWAAHGPAPAADGLVARILAHRQAADWAGLLPRWDVGPVTATDRGAG